MGSPPSARNQPERQSVPLDAHTLLGQCLPAPAGFLLHLYQAPAAAAVASYSPKEMKCHLKKIRGWDGDQALQRCNEEITVGTQKAAMLSDR